MGSERRGRVTVVAISGHALQNPPPQRLSIFRGTLATCP